MATKLKRNSNLVNIALKATNTYRDTDIYIYWLHDKVPYQPTSPLSPHPHTHAHINGSLITDGSEGDFAVSIGFDFPLLSMFCFFYLFSTIYTFF